MLIFTDLGMKPKNKVEQVKSNIILDEEEKIVFDMAIKNKSAQEIAFRVGCSPRTVFRMLAKIRTKVLNYYELEMAEDCQ